MSAYLLQVLDLALRGLLTELPAQLITAAVAAAAATGMRAAKKRRAAGFAEREEEEQVPDADLHTSMHHAGRRRHDVESA